jgi:hypothetical protein
MTIDTTGLSLSATPGSLSSVSIIPADYKVRDSVAYTFSFIISDDVPANG